ncbi:MAG: DUF1501 domain-containing protein [Rubricoccaceae bacterium]|nr:DUF1501 domain-containing protein [Rubricoccaceae bacterium]
MCDHHHNHDPHHPAPTERKIAIEDGAAHDHDHAAWSRRDFLTSAAAAAGGTAFLLGSTPVQATSSTSLLHALAQLETDRILVLIQLGGGNDGLNMVVPVTNDRYYQLRPTIAVQPGNTFALDGDYGLTNMMSSLQSMWGEGKMAIMHSVGYPDHNLSHFRSTDIWASASGADETLNSGWTGRYLDVEYPNYVTDPPEYPVAIRIGGASGLLLRGENTTMGMSFSNPSQFEQLESTGEFYDEDDVPDNVFGQELSFIRSVYNAALRYREVVIEAAEAGTNEAQYGGGQLAESLAIVARLIKGGLQSRLYVVQHGGFDTHSNQMNSQPGLLQSLANAVAAFTEDIELGGRSEDVLTMTFSEFGRRVEENGSNGTDHGTAAPLFVFGGGVSGGLFGDGPDLINLDGSGNMHHSTDFRDVYATVLQHWFGLNPATSDTILGGDFNPIGFVANPVSIAPPVSPAHFVLEPAYPNPFAYSTTVAFALDRPGQVRLNVMDVRGRRVHQLADGPHTAGRHTVRFDANELASGTYFIHMESSSGTQTQPVTVVR